MDKESRYCECYEVTFFEQHWIMFLWPQYWGARTDFSQIQNKIKSKLTGWKARVLSQSGKTALINQT